MAQMPEELRHLHQRSCPSASQNDKRPHMWQRCPGKRRLGNQPAIPCYSDCTVQYIIDCNLSLHTADDDTPDRLHCGTNTSNVTSSSPPSKRPRIDMVDFCSISSTVYITRHPGHHCYNSILTYCCCLLMRGLQLENYCIL